MWWPRLVGKAACAMQAKGIAARPHDSQDWLLYASWCSHRPSGSTTGFAICHGSSILLVLVMQAQSQAGEDDWTMFATWRCCQRDCPCAGMPSLWNEQMPFCFPVRPVGMNVVPLLLPSAAHHSKRAACLAF